MSAGGEGGLRVALVIGHLGYGGAERQLAELALHAGEHEVHVHVFCLGGPEEPFGSVLRRGGIPVSTIARRSGFDIARALGLAAALRRQRFDLVHSFLIDTNPYALIAARLAGIPSFIASNRNADFPRGRLRALVDAAAFLRASAIVVNARAVRTFTAERFGLPEHRFTVIYNGVDLGRFRPASTTRGSSLRIGTVGSLSAKKNPDLFATVAAELRGDFPESECLHLGDGPLRARLTERYRQVVRYLGSSVAAEEFLAGLDVFVLTSDREGCPNVLLEAMACGRAVVTTDAGGASEVVRDGVSGFVVGRGDAAALSDRVGRLLADGGLRRKLGEAARAEAERRFALPRMVEEMTGLYRRTARGGSSGGT